MTLRSQHLYRGSLVVGLLLSAALPATPGFAAPRRKKAAPPPRPATVAKPSAAKPSVAPTNDRDENILSRGEEAVLVDHLEVERTTLVLFYQPSVEAEAKVAEFLLGRSQADPRVAVRLVQLKSLEQPIAKQYEISATPSGFVYDRNKNLVGKGKTFEELVPLVGQALRTVRLKWINEDDPTAAEVYRTFGGGQRAVPEIMKTMSFHPGLMEQISQIAGKYHFADGFLSRRDHEIIASYVSALNKCKY